MFVFTVFTSGSLRLATRSSSGCSFFILQSASALTAPVSTTIMSNEVWSSSAMIESSLRQVKTVLIQQKVCELKYTLSVSQACFGQGSATKLHLNQVLSHLYYDVSFRNQDGKTLESSTETLLVLISHAFDLSAQVKDNKDRSKLWPRWLSPKNKKSLTSRFWGWPKEPHSFSPGFRHHVLNLRCPLLARTVMKSQQCSSTQGQSSSQCLYSVQSQKNRQTNLLPEGQNQQTKSQNRGTRLNQKELLKQKMLHCGTGRQGQMATRTRRPGLYTQEGRATKRHRWNTGRTLAKGGKE